jgi:SAM-dependent methyltransferase
MFRLYQEAGVIDALTIVFAGVDDRLLRRFDRTYGIETTGFIDLDQTSFDRSRLREATNYGPVNGWGFRRLLRELNLPKSLIFADLGSGLGRACIVAAEYGFAHVTGVELVGEFCAAARENVARCRPPAGTLAPTVIVQMDVLEYCAQSVDDVFFMYRPFSEDFLRKILTTLVERARTLKKPIVVIYAERVSKPENFSTLITQNAAFQGVCKLESWGQEFWVYRTTTSVETK